MFARIQRSWDLARACMRLLMADKSLLAFPLMSGVAMVLIVASFAAPLLAVGGILQGIYTAALYRYANGDRATPGVDKGLLESAFRPKT